MTELSTETRTAILEGVKLQLGIVDTAQDARLNALISRANAYAEKYLGFPIEPGEFTEELHIGGYAAPLLMPFSRLDVTEIVSIEADGSPLLSTSGIWRFDKAGMAIRFFGAMYIDVLTVTYKAGGETVEPLVVEAMLNFTVALYQQGPGSSGAIPLPPGTGSLVSIDIPGVYRASFRDTESNRGAFESIMPMGVAEILSMFKAESV